MIHEKIISRRSIRKYAQKPVPKETLVRCIEAARLSPSGANRQPLKYVVVNDEDLLTKVFQATRWAGYLPEWGPSVDEAPQAYVAILLDTNISKSPGHDAGIAAMSISMVAFDEGLGSCMLGSIDRPKLRELLKVPDHLEILFLVAIGYAAEQPTTDEVKEESIRYWLDEDSCLHVPKRSAEEILRWNTYE
jgi:nitroreductase